MATGLLIRELSTRNPLLRTCLLSPKCLVAPVASILAIDWLVWVGTMHEEGLLRVRFPS